MELISDAGEGDIILVEQIDRLARLKQSDWETLKRLLAEKRLMIRFLRITHQLDGNGKF